MNIANMIKRHTVEAMNLSTTRFLHRQIQCLSTPVWMPSMVPDGGQTQAGISSRLSMQRPPIDNLSPVSIDLGSNVSYRNPSLPVSFSRPSMDYT